MENKEDITRDIFVEWQTLINICGEEEMVRSIIEVFLDEGIYTLGMIDKAVSERNISDIKLYSHRMKGTARYFGDEDFVQKCYAAELAATNGNLEEAIALSKAIKPVTEKYINFFSRPDWEELLKHKAQLGA